MKLLLAFLLTLALVILPACTSPAGAPPPGSIIQEQEEETTTPAVITEEEEETTPPPIITQEDVDAARQVVFDYWDAYNSYDLEGVLSFLEESFRQEEEEDTKDNMASMQSAHVKLGVEEEAEPVITPEGKIEISIKLKTPIGSRHNIYQLTKINGEWKICLITEG